MQRGKIMMGLAVAVSVGVMGASRVVRPKVAPKAVVDQHLGLAVNSDDVDVTAYLLANRGASANTVYRGYPVLAIAVVHLQPRIVSLLLGFGADPNVRWRARCGRPRTPLEAAEGRIRDFARTPSGNRHPTKQELRRGLSAALYIRTLLLQAGAR